MREKLNENPLAQLAFVGVLLLVVGVFAMTSMGGGGEKEGEKGGEEAAEPAVAEPVGSPTSLPPVASGPGAPPPPPRAVTDAFAAGDTVVLLFVRPGGIDDDMVAGAVRRVESLSGVVSFVVPASKISRYASIAQGVDVNRVPALVVVRPKGSARVPTASVHYGYQSPKSVEQAVIDAGYKGRTLPYHP